MTASTAQLELVKVYKRERNRFYEFEAAMLQIVEEDFPQLDAQPETVTRWHVDALRDLTNRIAALVEGWSGR